jgi:hypothetical protein
VERAQVEVVTEFHGLLGEHLIELDLADDVAASRARPPQRALEIIPPAAGP